MIVVVEDNGDCENYVSIGGLDILDRWWIDDCLFVVVIRLWGWYVGLDWLFWCWMWCCVCFFLWIFGLVYLLGYGVG